MISVYASCTVKDENIEQFKLVAKNLIEETKKEAGNIQYDLIQNMKDKNQFAFSEKWKDEKSLQLHQSETHFTEAVPKLSTLTENGLSIQVFQVIS